MIYNSYSAFFAVALALSGSASARPARFGRRAAFDLANGQAAIKLNQQFATLTPTSQCTEGEDACVNGQFAQCANGKFVLTACGPGTVCAALPLVNSAGTSVTCDTQADVDARIAATGATSAGGDTGTDTTTAAADTTTTAAADTTTAAADTTTAAPPAATSDAATPPDNNNAGGGSATGGDLQDSLTLDPNIIQTTGTGQEPPVAGQASALTSKNNFANICSLGLPNVPITNGLQLTGGSCNPIPIGNIPSIQNVPSSKFQSPTNGETLKANTPFNVTLAVKNIQIGTFTAATETYYANPQTLNAQGQIIGHTHIVIEAIDALDSTTVTDPLKFAFFKGVDDAADANGQVTVPVAAGLAAGVYRMGTIMSSATHQPVIVAVAQHGIVDDVIYMTVQ
ncbi:hypothetical protein FB45DRAFT_1027684 [Roridomyces roridus]|jgi:hypothetical protein|uniref:Carbohydrate-binding module family 19 domain-containing protein n=1 Tax=Roridomyces roridus TaxID=1738132 RepID=A0AAD7FP94_9AGAR|nr:hypothetical protein FB45DRAFT_1027684 [Roridomyces roridus]